MSNSYGSTTVTQDVAVTVPSAPTVNLSVTPSTIDFGETANVTYSSYDAVFVSSNIPGASSFAYESVNVNPTTTTTYTVTLSNANGSTTETAELTVNPLAVPTIDTSASSNLSINIDDDPGATLDIAVTGATSITYSSSPADSGWDAQTSLTGTTYTTSPDATTVYTIQATNAAGTTTDTVTVTVTQLPTATLTANPAVMEIGSGAANPVSTTTLTWAPLMPLQWCLLVSPQVNCLAAQQIVSVWVHRLTVVRITNWLFLVLLVRVLAEQLLLLSTVLLAQVQLLQGMVILSLVT